MTKPTHKCKRGLVIEPPPREDSEEPLFRVVYVIDVNAAGVRDAAEYTHRIMIDPDSLAPVLHVIDGKGKAVTIDLSQESGQETVAQPAPADQQARRFVLSAATQCPNCGSQDLSFGSIDIDGQSAYQQASCQDCDAGFFAIYRLVGFGLHTGDQTEIHTVAEDFGQITE